MNSFRPAYLSVLLTLSLTQFCIAQENAITPDLAKIVDEGEWNIANREAKIVEEDDRLSIYFDAQSGDGVAWLKTIEVANGIIEVDIKGTDVRGRSFVGIAFRGVDERTFDAVYFRPFNFRSDDPVRKGHSVQYVSHPDYTWRRLREEHPEKFENPVTPIPDPNSFFHVKIVIETSKISVFVNVGEEPSLVVETLTDRRSGWIGLWTGNNSDGTFANLRIIPTES